MKIDAHSTTWIAVSKLAKELRESAIEELIRNPGNESYWRGQIAAVDKIIRLSVVEPPTKVESVNYFDD